VGTSIGSDGKGNRDGETGNSYHLFEKDGGTKGDKVEADFTSRMSCGRILAT